jgi:hypothetical protein
MVYKRSIGKDMEINRSMLWTAASICRMKALVSEVRDEAGGMAGVSSLWQSSRERGRVEEEIVGVV